MAVLNRRGRIVSFRVSEQEYQLLVELSATQGAHSVSEFARTLAFLSPSRNSPVAEVKAQAQIHDLRDRYSELTHEIQELRDRIEEGWALLRKHHDQLAELRPFDPVLSPPTSVS